jgi:hypothetical protein
MIKFLIKYKNLKYWGTGLRDANDIMDDLIINKKATIIIHLGDIYYASWDF